jgi:uncharacterized phage protein (TIGR02218 family)
MSYDSIEQSGSGAQPWEIYLFQTTGKSFLLTSSDEPIVYLGQEYDPTTISRTELDHTNDVISGQIKITIPPSHPLAAEFIPYLPPTPMEITIFGGHFGDSDVVVLFTGNVASSLFTDQCELTCNSDLYRLQRQIPKKLYQAPCAHVFGDTGCGINLALFTTAGTIASVDVTGTVLHVSAFNGLAHSLRGGYLVRGQDVRMIVDHTGDQVTLLTGIGDLEVDQAVSGVAGCQHTYPACQSYNNVPQFFGFDLMPATNPFDGSVG